VTTRHALEEAIRVRAARALPWLQQPAAWVVLLIAAVALGGGLWWALSSRDPFPRPRENAKPPQVEAALERVQERLREDPQDIEALVEFGTLSFERGRDFYPDAVNALEEARDLGALDARVFYCLGVMYQELGLYPFAVTEYRRFLRNHSKDKEVRLRLAKLLYRNGSFQEAVSEYERLKYDSPGDKLIEENLGLSLWSAKSPERASEVFSGLKAAGGEIARRADYYLGQLALERGEHALAAEHLQGVKPEEAELGLPPEQVYAALGAALQKLDRVDEAKEAWNAVLRLVPGDTKATAALRQLNRKKKR
jgi:Flp pilus assembly protein TadD